MAQWGELKLHQILEDCKDSLLFDDGTLIAEIASLDNRYRAGIFVRGCVRIYYKGERYDWPSKFPTEIIEAIRNNTLNNLEEFDIINNNWYEIEVYDNVGYIDGDCWEASLDDYTVEKLRNEMTQYLDEVVSAYEEIHDENSTS